MGGTYTMQGAYYFPDLILRSHLTDIEKEAQSLFLRLVKEYAEREGFTEQLKAEKQMEWGGKMNNVRSKVTEIVNRDVVYG